MSIAKLRKTVAVALSVAALTLAFALPVAAHPVGEASEPNCFGQRISHGASRSPVHGGHGLTPVERRDVLRVTFPEDEDITIAEMMQFIKMCFEPLPPGDRPVEL